MQQLEYFSRKCGKACMHHELLCTLCVFQESRSSKLKSVFKRRRSRSEERKSLLGNGSTEDNMREEEEDDDKVTVGCINSWLLYIFIKIFD